MKKVLIIILTIALTVMMVPMFAYADTTRSVPEITKVVQSGDLVQIQFDAPDSNATTSRYFMLEGRVSGGEWQLVDYKDLMNTGNYLFNFEGGKAGDLIFEANKTYEFRACYASSDFEYGPYSAVQSVIYVVEEEPEEVDNKAIIDTPIKETSSGGYSATKEIKKGMSKTWENDAFKLTMTVSKAAASQAANLREMHVTYDLTLVPKITETMCLSLYDNTGKYTNANLLEDVTWECDGQKYYTYDTLEAGKTYTSSVSAIYFSDKGEIGKLYVLANMEFIHGSVEKPCYFDFAVAPGVYQPDMEYSVEATKSSITIKNFYINEGTTLKMFYKAKSDKKWKSKNVKGKSITVKKLKANTEYQFQFQSSMKSDGRDGKTVTIKSNKTPVLKVKTAIAKAPVIKSVTITKAKYKYNTTKAHWDSWGNWVPAKKNYFTTFKVKVTLKSKVKGAKALAIKIGDGVFYAKNGKTVTVNASAGGNKIGKSISIKVASCNNKYHIGVSPYSKAKKAKVKK